MCVDSGSYITCEHYFLSTRFNTCPPYVKVESKIKSDFAAQCSLLITYASLKLDDELSLFYLLRQIRRVCHAVSIFHF